MKKRNTIIIGCLVCLGVMVNSEIAASAPPTAIAQSAIAQSAIPQSTVEPIPGWEKFEGEGIAVWLPENFEGGSLEMIDSITSNLRRLGSNYETIAQTIEANRSAFILFAYDPKAETSGGVTNMTVTKGIISDAVSLETYMDSAVSSIARLIPNSAASQSIISLNGNRVGQIVNNASISEIQIKQVAYIFKDNNRVVVVVYSTSLEEFDERLPIFEQSAATLTF